MDNKKRGYNDSFSKIIGNSANFLFNMANPFWYKKVDIDLAYRLRHDAIGRHLRACGEFFKSMSYFFNYMLMGNLAAQNRKAAKFCEVVGAPITKTKWMTENKVELNLDDKVLLRRFSYGKNGKPLVIVAPEAGHDSTLADFAKDQSLVACALDNYNGDVYVVDKLPAQEKHQDYSLDDCIHSLISCLEHINKPANVVGLCQGGWQSVIAAAKRPELFTSITPVAAPIDFHAGDAIIAKIVKEIPQSFFECMTTYALPGQYLIMGFKNMNPLDRYFLDYVKLWQNIDDDQVVKRFLLFNDWYQRSQSLPKKMYLETVEKLFRNNEIVRGALIIDNQTINLLDIYHPLILIAGATDEITPKEQVYALAEHASSKSIEKILINQGHIGTFMSKKAIKNHYPIIFRTIQEF